MKRARGAHGVCVMTDGPTRFLGIVNTIIYDLSNGGLCENQLGTNPGFWLKGRAHTTSTLYPTSLLQQISNNFFFFKKYIVY